MTNLVELAKMGDKPAFDEIIRECVPDLFRIAFSILKNKDDADDAVCESVVKAYENIHRLRDCSLFKTWITRILINQANAAYKRRRRFLFFSEAPRQREPQYEDVYDCGDSALNAAVSNLNPELRTAVALFYFQDMKITEIAETLKVPVGTVKWRLSKAKEILRKNLSGDNARGGKVQNVQQY